MQIAVIIINILLVLALLFSFGFVVLMMLSNFTKAPFVPSFAAARRKMIELADLNKDDVVYDLGSGDGRLVFDAANKDVTKAVGFETNPLLVLISNIKRRIKRAENTEFVLTNYLNADLSKCTKLFVYLLPSAMKELEEKVLKDMPANSLIISNTFRFTSIKPIRSEISPKVFVYKIEK